MLLGAARRLPPGLTRSRRVGGPATHTALVPVPVMFPDLDQGRVSGVSGQGRGRCRPRKHSTSLIVEGLAQGLAQGLALPSARIILGTALRDLRKVFK